MSTVATSRLSCESITHEMNRAFVDTVGELVSSASRCCLLPSVHPLPFVDSSFFCFYFIRYSRAPLFYFQIISLLGVTQLY